MELHVYWSPQQIVSSGKYPLTLGQLRYLLLHRHKTGLQGAVRKIGKRLVIRIDLFEKWIEAQSITGGR
jgi:hypothetical protein